MSLPYREVQYKLEVVVWFGEALHSKRKKEKKKSQLGPGFKGGKEQSSFGLEKNLHRHVTFVC